LEHLRAEHRLLLVDGRAQRLLAERGQLRVVAGRVDERQHLGRLDDEEHLGERHVQVAREREQILAAPFVVEDFAHAHALRDPRRRERFDRGLHRGLCNTSMIGFPSMGATYLMSYPAKRWTIRGGENFRSKEKQATNPRGAMREWLALCDAITRHGGRILV